MRYRMGNERWHKIYETILTNWIDPDTSSAASDQKLKFVGSKGRYEADQKERGIRINTDQAGIEHINPDFCMPYGTEDGKLNGRDMVFKVLKHSCATYSSRNETKSLKDLEIVDLALKNLY